MLVFLILIRQTGLCRDWSEYYTKISFDWSMLMFLFYMMKYYTVSGNWHLQKYIWFQTTFVIFKKYGFNTGWKSRVKLESAMYWQQFQSRFFLPKLWLFYKKNLIKKNTKIIKLEFLKVFGCVVEKIDIKYVQGHLCFSGEAMADSGNSTWGGSI